MTVHQLRVVLADDHPIILEGLATLLSTSPNIQVVGRCRSFSDVIDLLDSHAIDVLVLDLGGMGGSPLTLVNRIAREHPEVAIIVYSSSVDLAPELLAAGVRGYIAKEDLTDQLVAAVQAAHTGQPHISPVVRDYLQSTELRQPHHLSPKEFSVLKLLAQGMGTVAIAEQLGIDPRSVQNYITALRRKTGCAERTQLVDWYRRMYGTST